MKKIPITKTGFEDLRTELKHLKEVERPSVIESVAEAREHGDLSENAEYHAAREKHSFIEGRIAEIESILSMAEVIDPKQHTGSNIRFGATVVIVCCETEEKKTYTIVGNTEADLNLGKIAISSPIAKALIGKEVGDIIQVSAPSGIKEFEILKVSYL